MVLCLCLSTLLYYDCSLIAALSVWYQILRHAQHMQLHIQCLHGGLWEQRCVIPVVARSGYSTASTDAAEFRVPMTYPRYSVVPTSHNLL